MPFLLPGVEQDMKNWEGEKFRSPKNFCSCPPTIPVCPPTIGGTCLFLALQASSLGHACCDHNESESYRSTIIICRHCVDQQSDLLVFTKFQSDGRTTGSEAIEKWEGKDPFSPP